MTREYALQERSADGKWITVSRHPTASAAVDAAFEKGVSRLQRVVEVLESEVVWIGEPDERNLTPHPAVRYLTEEWYRSPLEEGMTGAHSDGRAGSREKIAAAARDVARRP